jgi:hypothetical protein
MCDWRMWRHEWFGLVIALKICIISRSAKRPIKGVFIPLYVSLITWKWKSNYFYSILEVFHKVLWKIKNRVICPLKSCHLSYYPNQQKVINDTYKGINTPFIGLFADLEIMQILSAITRPNHSWRHMRQSSISKSVDWYRYEICITKPWLTNQNKHPRGWIS